MPRSGYLNIGSEESKENTGLRAVSQQIPRPSALEIEVPAAATKTTGSYLPINSLAKDVPRKGVGAALAISLLLAVGVVAFSASTPVVLEGDAEGTLGYGVFDAMGRTVLKDYDQKRTFASFLPAIGGEFGTPMWAFYVNRGQGITSYGTENKDTAIMEFNSANKAYEYAGSDGFRTFVKGTRSGGLAGGGASFVHEPFGLGDNAVGVSRDMFVGMNNFGVQEVDTAHALQTNVEYFTVPGEEFAALARRTTFTNLGSTDLDMEVLDGHPKLEPAGTNDWNLKNMGRTMEAWMNVYNMAESSSTEPFYKLSLSMADTAQVTMIEQGHWAISFLEFKADKDADEDDAPVDDKTSTAKSGASTVDKLPFIVDPAVIFGQGTSLAIPANFEKTSVADLVNGKQITTSKTPCAFAAAQFSLPAGANVTLTTLYGRATSKEQYDSAIKDVVVQAGYVDKKFEQATALITKFTEKVSMKSGVPVFDKYVREQYLDNFLRGGYPVVLGEDKDPKIFHTFSRIHGDLERDYNYFQIDASFFSVGPGNFRDVEQNRRMDSVQEPKVKGFNVRMFLSLVQADGYNPLTVNSVYFLLPDATLPPELVGGLHNGTRLARMANSKDGVVEGASPMAKALAATLAESKRDQGVIAALLSNTAGYRPGDLFIAMALNEVQISVTQEAFVNAVAAAGTVVPSATFAQNGFWADHWTYHLDLVDSFLTVFPDEEQALLFGAEGGSPFFMSPDTCFPRSKKYVLAPKLGPRQYNFVYDDAEKIAAIAANALHGDPSAAQWQRRADTGAVYEVDAYTKLLVLAMSKFTIMDPLGMGVEYEGGKPGWNDAMNGLCALFGSGMPEAYEALRIFKFLASKAEAYPTQLVQVPEEMNALMVATVDAMQQLQEKALTPFQYWDVVRTAVEAYREATRVTFTGTTVAWSMGSGLLPLYAQVIAKMERGSKAAVELYGRGGTLAPTYWIFTVDEYDVLDGFDDAGRAFVKPRRFTPEPVPLFLEGPTRQMKTLGTQTEKKQVYDAVKQSPLRDEPLGMYTISESLAGMSFEIGRMMAFAPGWLENESVWLHMSYKFYLEILRAGLYDEFFDEMKTGLVAFLDPEVYGRSPLECSSFIASSAHPDASIHGQGFLARLSGSTAEFLSMWNLMMMGPEPFVYTAQARTEDAATALKVGSAEYGSARSEGSLSLRLSPIFPGDWFDSEGEMSFLFLGLVAVTYHNPSKKDTWDPNLSALKCTVTLASEGEAEGGAQVHFDGGTIPATYAKAAREGGVYAIDVYFGEKA